MSMHTNLQPRRIPKYRFWHLQPWLITPALQPLRRPLWDPFMGQILEDLATGTRAPYKLTIQKSYSKRHSNRLVCNCYTFHDCNRSFCFDQYHLLRLSQECSLAELRLYWLLPIPLRIGLKVTATPNSATDALVTGLFPFQRFVCHHSQRDHRCGQCKDCQRRWRFLCIERFREVLIRSWTWRDGIVANGDHQWL